MAERLSDRLEHISKWIPKGASVVDVGTDHALLPIALVERGICTKVIASDIAKGPLDAARNHVVHAGLISEIDLRLGPGLSTVDAGEVDTAVIAGMGGGTIADILSEGHEVIRDLKELVLQPMNAAARLRDSLRNLHFTIVDEQYVKDNQRVYQLIHARPDVDGLLSAKLYAPFIETHQEWLALEFGPISLSRADNPLVTASLQTEAAHLRTILVGLKERGQARTDSRRVELEDELRQIERWLHAGCVNERGKDNIDDKDTR